MTGRVGLSASTWRQPWPPLVNPRRTAAVEHIAARIRAIDLPRVRVAIDGRSAAGKTTLGHELAWVLAGEGLVVLRASLDDFKRPWSERHLYDRISGEGFCRNAHDFDANEVDAVALAHIVVDNTDLEEPRIVRT